MQNLTIIVGSTNPVKIKTAETVFSKTFPGHAITVTGYKAASGVADQPMDSNETLTGAINRVLACKTAFPEADFYVGMEGGVEPDHTKEILTQFAWMYVIDNNEKAGQAKTAEFIAPKAYYDLVVKEGLELGHASDRIFDQTNSKQGLGSSGLLTKGAIDRQAFYEQGLYFALLPFINPDLY